MFDLMRRCSKTYSLSTYDDLQIMSDVADVTNDSVNNMKVCGKLKS